MNIIPEVKCRRCGESFSSMRSRCPNCGTRRVSQSTRSPATPPSTVSGTAAYARASANTRWQLIFGLILVAAVILAVVVMVSTGLSDIDNATAKTQASMPMASAVTELVETAPTPSPTPTPTVETIAMIWGVTHYEDSEFTMHLSTSEDEEFDMTAQAYPLTIENPTFEWSVDNDGILELTPNATGSECHIKQIGTIAGGVKLTVTCCGVSASTRVYCLE